MKNTAYRIKYHYGRYLPLKKPVDVSLELSSHCNMRCEYCLDPETPVLSHDFKWKKIEELKPGDKIASFEEFAEAGCRKMAPGVIEKIWETEKETIKITTTLGDVTCSLDHRFLDESGRWVYARNLTVGRKMSFAKDPWESPDLTSLEFMVGYLRGMTEGDGTARWQPLPGSTGHADDSRRQVWWRVAIKDREPLDRIVDYFSRLGIEHPGIKPFSAAHDKYAAIDKIEIRNRKNLDKLYDVIYNSDIKNNEEFEKGYLSGIFDSEGSHSCNILRIAQKKENGVCEKVLSYLGNFEFKAVREDTGVRLLGGLWERIRFLGMFSPVIGKNIDRIYDTSVQHKKAVVISVENLGVRKLIDIQTSTKTFYGAGFPTHNCYHTDQDGLPFKTEFMDPILAFSILRQMAENKVPSVKFNWRGESSLNPAYADVLYYAYGLYERWGYPFDRLINSNFMFTKGRQEILAAMSKQTKVKVSFDSFIPEVYEKQRRWGIHKNVLRNIDDFYSRGSPAKLVIQAVRTKLNADEDIAGEIKKRWPQAGVSIRDVVAGRNEVDTSELIDDTRAGKARTPCRQAFVRLIVAHNGDVSPCCPDIKQQLVLGNAKIDKIVDIFNNEKAEALRKSLRDKSAFAMDPCKNCSSHESYAGYKPAWNS